ncbi:mannonate dehydratase [Formosa haliotis]|uniref:mannonate dehydratase n=1 Tax=Formosa haliotis TaxID=1555194 RepID=UPI000826D393|nr:mannonate dehydratase [Formosa haliotis]
MKLIKTLRWFGDKDAISLSDIRQTGATGIVTALHHIPNGEVWSVKEILKTKHNIESHGLTWEVVESLPVTEEIKKATPLRDLHIANYKESVKNLGKCGIKTICYNFMPVLDWARTDLHFTLENGGEAMYFSANKFAAFDLFILKRPNAAQSYTETQIKEAKEIFEGLSDEEKEALGYNIIVKTQSFIDGTVNEGEKNYLNIFNKLLAEYDHVDKNKLRENFSYFLNEVIPVAEQAGVNLAVHPDDPPFPLLGLPRIVSSGEDFEWLSQTCPSLNNGITFCSGSLGAKTTNDLANIFRNYANRVHFIHLRSTKVMENGDFFETDHLDEYVDMTGLMTEIVKEQIRRKDEGRLDFNLPLRPDHGHKILDDFNRQSNPGYPLLGRLKGLAEMAGLEAGIKYGILKEND